MLRNSDKHMNVFINHNDQYQLENNLTKALVNTLSYLETGEQLAILSTLTEEPDLNVLAPKRTRIRYSLQQKPRDFDVAAVPPDHRIQLGLCPSGKAWVEGLLQIGSLPKGPRTAVAYVYDTLFPDPVDPDNPGKKPPRDSEKWTEAEKIYKDIRNHEENGSIPDAWAVIEVEGVPEWCIIVENKWVNLDPHQLREHREKALEHEQAKTTIRSLPDMYDIFMDAKCHLTRTALVPDFLEYLTIIGQEPINRFYPSGLEAVLAAKGTPEEAFYTQLFHDKFYRFFNQMMDGRAYDRKRRRIAISDSEDFNLTIDFQADKGDFYIVSEIGVKSQWVNQKLFPLLFAEPSSLAQAIQAQYPGAEFQRFVRLHKWHRNYYAKIAAFDTISDYCAHMQGVPISRSKQTTLDCLALLDAQQVEKTENAYQALLRVSPDDTWNALEYLRIQTKLNILPYLHGPDLKQLQQVLEVEIANHRDGLCMLLKELNQIT